MTTTQKKSLYKINPKSIKINKPLTDISSPGFCFSIFWLQLARPSQAAEVKQLQLIVFNKCSVAKWALDAKWALSQVKWKQPYEWSFWASCQIGQIVMFLWSGPFGKLQFCSALSSGYYTAEFPSCHICLAGGFQGHSGVGAKGDETSTSYTTTQVHCYRDRIASWTNIPQTVCCKSVANFQGSEKVDIDRCGQCSQYFYVVNLERASLRHSGSLGPLSYFYMKF